MIVASPTLGAADWDSLVRSKLYDPSFTHRFRDAVSAADPVERVND
jgi:precorrin-4/cobalt-precorrin-4 C11-methyltransferase